MPESASRKGGGSTCLVPGGVGWGVYLVLGVYLPGPGGVYLPGPGGGVPAWSRGCTCLVPGGYTWVQGGCICLVQGGVPAWSGGGYLVRYPPPPRWTEWHTLMKILPCPKLRLRAVMNQFSFHLFAFSKCFILILSSTNICMSTLIHDPLHFFGLLVLRLYLWSHNTFWQLVRPIWQKRKARYSFGLN